MEKLKSTAISMRIEDVDLSCLAQYAKSPVIIHIDVDAFECQVYERVRPDLRGQPMVVANSGGRIVSANYPAKRFGVTRELRVTTARKRCPKLRVIIIPDHPRWCKSDKVTARYSSWEILDDAVIPYRKLVAPKMVVNFASIDEFFFDVTETVTERMAKKYTPDFTKFAPKTILEGRHNFYSQITLENRLDKLYAPGCKSPDIEDEIRLMHGAIIAEELVQKIWTETKFKVSAGVGHNMLTAKLGTSLHKPQGITVLPKNGLNRVSRKIRVGDIPGLGGERGKQLKRYFQIEFMHELQSKSADQIAKCLGKDMEVFAKKVKEMCNGIDNDKVVEKTFNETINCGKIFFTRFDTFEEFCQQVEFLFEEIFDRIQEEKYRTKRLPVSLRIEVQICDQQNHFSKTAHSFEWQNIPCVELFHVALDGMSKNGFNTESNKFRDANGLKLTAKLKGVIS